jgi:opacity protein-like surface antigen
VPADYRADLRIARRGPLILAGLALAAASASAQTSTSTVRSNVVKIVQADEASTARGPGLQLDLAPDSSVCSTRSRGLRLPRSPGVRLQPDFLPASDDQQTPKPAEPQQKPKPETPREPQSKPRTQPPARSQPQAPQTGPPAFTIGGLVDFGFASFSASRPLEAVYETSTGLIWGGGVRIGHRSGLFGQVTAYRFGADGERVFVSGGQVFKLGIPTSLTVVPLDFTAGWRWLPRQRTTRPAPPAKQPPPRSTSDDLVRAQRRGGQPPPARPAPTQAQRSPRRFIPYVGGGIGVVRITEEAGFANSGDDVNEQHTSYHVLGGVDFPLSRLFGAGVETGWRWVPDALAGSGVAEEFDETNLDHFFLMVRFTIGR